MKKIIGIVTVQFVLAMPVYQVSATNVDAKDVAGVVIQTKRIPVMKNGKAGKPFVENMLVHNSDSGVSQDDAKKLADSALKDDATKAPDDNAVSLGILSTIGGAISSGVGLITNLITGKPILGGVV